MTSGPESDATGRFWLADVLWRLGGVQFGDFSLGRTVRHSPVYVNPKLIIARPAALSRVANLIEEELRMAMARRKQPVAPFDLIAGVPIGGLHIATALALQMRTPLLYARPDGNVEAERPHIEGIYRPGQVALVVDDLATGGGSLVETVTRLRRAGLRVHDALVLVDREQGAERRLESIGVRLYSILSIEVMLTYLHSASRLPEEDYRRAMHYLVREGSTRSEFD
ncbi:MAG: orotate phosphoribosyltransferase [Dehalococcoidia bacterium]